MSQTAVLEALDQDTGQVLAQVTGRTLATGLELLGIAAPERM
ncbi:DALR anticodon-binding domain-containing protein [Myceligenerans xiligouense]|nr:DALR anticodon-binding domain-containing protein [Myceligenerans xiligouense]